jgi:hypothetical protein
MKPNYYSIIDQCIDVGVRSALATNDQLDEYDRVVLTENISREIWLQLDTYFTFTDNDND